MLTVPESGFETGRRITVVLGDRTGGGKGIRVCPDHVFNKFFVLYSVTKEEAEPTFPQWAGGGVWAKGTDRRIVAACTMHILGGDTDHLAPMCRQRLGRDAPWPFSSGPKTSSATWHIANCA